MDKTDIIRYLSKLRGYRTYLEICTPTTGNRFAEVARARFDVRHRLMYNCPPEFSDGMKIDFRFAGLDIERCIDEIRRMDLRYDIVLADSWHEYQPSLPRS